MVLLLCLWVWVVSPASAFAYRRIAWASYARPPDSHIPTLHRRRDSPDHRSDASGSRKCLSIGNASYSSDAPAIFPNRAGHSNSWRHTIGVIFDWLQAAAIRLLTLIF